MERLLSHHQHSVLGILPHVFIHVEGSYWHVDPTRQKLHLNQNQQTPCLWHMQISEYVFTIHPSIMVLKVFRFCFQKWNLKL